MPTDLPREAEFFPFGKPPPETKSDIEDVTENDEDEDLWIDNDDDQSWVPALKLSNGTSVSGVDAAGEYYIYELGIRLNALGRDLLTYVTVLIDVGIVTIDDNTNEFISVAPWHHRAV